MKFHLEYNNQMVRSLRQYYYVPLLLITLLIMVISPRLLSGWQDERQAQRSIADGEYSQAALLFESAAQRLPWRYDLWEQAGMAALAMGDWDGAILFLDKAETKGLLSYQGKIAIGDSYEKKGDLVSAIKIWKGALTVYETKAELFDRLAQAYHSLRDFTAEEGELRDLIALQPQNASTHYRLGLLLVAKRPEEALSELILSARLEPELDPRVQILRAGLDTALLEDDHAYRLVVSGQALAAIKEWGLAVQAFSQAIAIRADYAEAWALLGETIQNLDQDGLPYLDKALNLDPDSVLVHALRGLYWQRQKESKKALAEFQMVVKLEPENPTWLAALGDAYAQYGNLPPALDAYQRAVSLVPNDPLYWRLLAVFCVQFDVQVNDIGLPAAVHAISLAPRDALARDAAGWVFLTLGIYNMAEEQLLYAFELEPNLASAHFHLALLYLQKNQRDFAYEHLVRVLDLDSNGILGQQAARLLVQYYPK